MLKKIVYTVLEIDGDYAVVIDQNGIEKRIPMDLLPLENNDDMKIEYENPTYQITKTKTDHKKILKFCSLISKISLENGAETYRAEDLVYHTCRYYDIEKVAVLAIPTGILITLEDEETSLVRIQNRSTDLYNIEQVNSICRDLTVGKLDIDQALNKLNDLTNQKVKTLKYIFTNGFSSGFFALLFLGDFKDFILAFLCGIISQSIFTLIKKDSMYKFTSSLIGGFIVGAIAVLYSNILSVNIPDKMVLGAMMPLLPGLVMTNAIRDAVSGDLVSGTARFAEALIIALSLATGVGMIIIIFNNGNIL